MGREPEGLLVPGRNDVDQPGREAGLDAQLADAQPAERGRFGRFEDDGVAHDHRRAGLYQRQGEGEIEGGDERNDANWIIEIVRMLVRVERVTGVYPLPAAQDLGLPGEVAEMIEGGEDLERDGFEHRLSLLESDQPRDGVDLIVDQTGKAAEAQAPLLERDASPES